MKRIEALFLALILCLSLPVVTGFVRSPEIKQNQLNLYKTTEESILAENQTSLQEQNKRLKTNDVSFAIGNMTSGNQQKVSWVAENASDFICYLDLERITIIGNENGCLEPEIEAGDTTPEVGELQKIINIMLLIDKDKNGCWNNGDIMIYNGPSDLIAGAYNLNEPVYAYNDIQVLALFDWPAESSGNEAMGDDMTLNITFELAQTTGQ